MGETAQLMVGPSRIVLLHRVRDDAARRHPRLVRHGAHVVSLVRVDGQRSPEGCRIERRHRSGEAWSCGKSAQLHWTINRRRPRRTHAAHPAGWRLPRRRDDDQAG